MHTIPHLPAAIAATTAAVPCCAWVVRGGIVASPSQLGVLHSGITKDHNLSGSRMACELVIVRGGDKAYPRVYRADG